MLLTVGDPAGYSFFALAALFYVLSLIPTALSKVEQPKPLVESRLELRKLIRTSPIAVAGAFLMGVSNSAFGTLGVVFGETISLDVTTIALMMSISILAGSAFQVPIGMLSDRFDRRAVLTGIAILAALVDAYFIFFRPTDPTAILIASALFGGAIYSMYPVIVAHAFDHAEAGAYLRISGGLLLTYGVGAIAGPLVAGAVMAWSPETGLFFTTLGAHAALALFSLYRMTRRVAVEAGDKTEFVGMPATRFATPESMTLDPRSEDAGPPRDDAEGK
jgi:MFS family permease